MAVCFAAWLGLATQRNGNRLVEVQKYVRPAVALSGEDQLPALPETAGPEALAIVYGGLYDAPTGGRLLAYWLWLPPPIMVGSPWPDIRLTFDLRMQQALNRSRVPGHAEDHSVASGQVLGSMNGRDFVSGIRLAIHGGVIMSSLAVEAKRTAADAA